MSAYKYAYRMRVYAARSVDATEATVLTPAGSAPHADEFKVASVAGVSGYQPYLQDTIQGRRGRIDLKSRKLDIGTLTVTLIDKRITAGDNLTRWVSAFFGNSAGKPWPRLKVQLDECLDHTATSPTWTTFFTGEIVGSKLVAKNQWALTLRERTETLKMRCFEGTPHTDITYVAIPTLCPIGFRGANYGTQTPTAALAGTARNLVVNGTAYAPSGERTIILTPGSTGGDHEGNIVTANLFEALAPGTVVTADYPDPSANEPLSFLPNFSGKVRAYMTHGGNSGVFMVGGLGVTNREGQGFKVHSIAVRELTSSDTGYLAAPAAGTAVTLHI